MVDRSPSLASSGFSGPATMPGCHGQGGLWPGTHLPGPGGPVAASRRKRSCRGSRCGSQLAGQLSSAFPGASLNPAEVPLLGRGGKSGWSRSPSKGVPLAPTWAGYLSWHSSHPPLLPQHRSLTSTPGLLLPHSGFCLSHSPPFPTCENSIPLTRPGCSTSPSRELP